MGEGGGGDDPQAHPHTTSTIATRPEKNEPALPSTNTRNTRGPETSILITDSKLASLRIDSTTRRTTPSITWLLWVSVRKGSARRSLITATSWLWSNVACSSEASPPAPPLVRSRNAAGRWSRGKEGEEGAG